MVSYSLPTAGYGDGKLDGPAYSSNIRPHPGELEYLDDQDLARYISDYKWVHTVDTIVLTDDEIEACKSIWEVVAAKYRGVDTAKRKILTAGSLRSRYSKATRSMDALIARNTLLSLPVDDTYLEAARPNTFTLSEISDYLNSPGPVDLAPAKEDLVRPSVYEILTPRSAGRPLPTPEQMTGHRYISPLAEEAAAKREATEDDEYLYGILLSAGCHGNAAEVLLTEPIIQGYMEGRERGLHLEPTSSISRASREEGDGDNTS
ncbi:hypothetical protein B0O99DRAFT_735971 [Bisporella sp. PMI_857]|nr:hypothetical protein B0O99DRAFT_735971 [Bisporella sp. PMI_857]